MINYPIYYLKSEAIQPNIYGAVVCPQSDDYDKLATILDSSVQKAVVEILHNPASNENYIYNYDNIPEKQVLFGELGSAEEKRIVYHFFSLFCDEYDQIVLNMRTWKDVKVWVNMELFTVTNGDHLFFLKLRKGENIFIVETSSAAPMNSFFLRFEPYGYEFEDNLQYCAAESFYTPDKIARLYCRRYQVNSGDPFTFIIFSNDMIHVDQGQKVQYEVVNHFSGEQLQTGYLHFGERFVIDTAGLVCTDSDKLNCLDVVFHARQRNGERYSFSHPLYPYEMDQPMDNLVAYTESILEKPTEYCVNEFDIHCIVINLDIIKRFNRYYITSMNAYRELADVVYKLERGVHVDDSYMQSGCHKVYIKNPLDGSSTVYTVSVPKGYDSNRNYPLMVYFSTVDLTDYSKFYEDQDIIAVDIRPLGFTMGSYIGEAYILAMLEDIRTRFSIDAERVWVAGHSNGAYAAWGLAMAYPHLFAGILTVSGGVDTSLISNLHNTTVINVSSKEESEYRRCYELPHQFLEHLPRATEICAPNHTHNSLMYFMLNNRTIRLLQKSPLDMNPDEIDFTTCRNRHCRSFWVELHGISYGQTTAHVHAIVEEDTVYIYLLNATGVTISIPPQVKNELYNVVINGESKFSYNNSTRIHHYVHNDGEFVEADTKPQIANIHKGNGLLDIFLKPVQIITASSSDAEMACARAFSSPRTNGYIPVISINYPIHSIERLVQKNVDCNIILIDSGQVNHPHLQEIRKTAPVQMDESGYIYRGKNAEEKYCIMQIFDNPMGPGSSILYIRANDPSYLQKNLFTRQPILPTYASGQHPYWNNDALIYTLKGYTHVFEF